MIAPAPAVILSREDGEGSQRGVAATKDFTRRRGDAERALLALRVSA